jgi:hypothetical protein
MNVASLLATLDLDASGFNSNINVAINQINNIRNYAARAQNALQGMITVGNQISSVGRTWTYAIGAPLIAIGTEAVKTTARFDQMKSALTAITGSADEATRQMVRLNEIAKEPGIGIEEAIQGSINLQSVGFSAEKAERAVRAFGNALVYSGRQKSELAGIEEALAKIKGRGEITERQFMMISNRIPKMRELLQEAFGTGNLADIRKSGLSIDEVLERIISAAEKIPHVTGGIQNDMDNFADNTKRAADNIGDAMKPIIHDFTTSVGPAIEDLSKKFADLTKSQKEDIIAWAAFAIALGPVLIGLGSVITALARIQMLMTAISATSFVAGGGAALAVGAIGIPLAAGVIANRANEVAEAGSGKAPVSGFDMLYQMPGVLTRNAKQWAFGVNGQLPDWADDDKGISKDYAVNAAADYARRKAAGEPSVKSRLGGDKQGTLPDPQATEKDERTILRARLQAELEIAKSTIDSGSEQGRIQAELVSLGPILQQQAEDLRKEASEIQINAKTSAKDLVAFWNIQREAAALDSQLLKLQGAAQKEREREAKAARDTNYRVSEIEFHTRENNAMSEGIGGTNVPDHMKAQAVFANIAPVLKQRQQQLIRMWQTVGEDAENANEFRLRRAQLEAEYYDIERKGATFERAALQERATNDKKQITDGIASAKAYREFQYSRLRAMAEEAEEGKQAEAILNAELPALKETQKEIIDEQKTFLPNSKEYWDNAKAYWSVEDQIHKLVKNAVKERHTLAENAIKEQKRQSTEHREMLSLETQLMEARLKNNPLISATQRTQIMIPMLIRQYRQMLIPIQGETELESLHRQIDAEKIKHDIMESAGALGKNASARVLGGGRIDLFNRRMIQQVMGELDKPMSPQEQVSYLNPAARARQLADEFSRGRPVVLQINLPNDPSTISREVYEALDNLNKGAAPFPTRR